MTICLVPQARSQSRQEKKGLLVPVDFSSASCHALKHALSLVGQKGQRAILIHVIPAAENLARPELKAEAKTKLRDLISREATGSDHFIQSLVRIGIPFQEILAAAEELATAMIVLGVDEPSNLSPVSLGHTAERVLRYATSPVLLVRPTEATANALGKEPVRE